MKKIVSCTIATALATTNLTTMSVEAMKSGTKVNDSNNINQQINNSTEVIVEDTDKIENNNTNIESNDSNNSNLNQNDNLENGSYDEKDDNSNSEETLIKDNISSTEGDSITSDEKLEEKEDKENLTVEDEKNDNENEVDTTTENTEEDKGEVEDKNKFTFSEGKKNYGKLEFDINFNMPIINTDSININLFKGNEKIGKISSLVNDYGVLDNGATYKIEKLNSKKQLLEDEEKDIYFLHITIEKLDLGTYSAEIKSESYIDTKVDNIEIKDFSKRVILGNNYNETLKYNGVFLAGDVNGDGKIDMGDYNLVFENIGSSNSKYDINKDGRVNIADLTYVNENIGSTIGDVEIVNTDAILDLNKIVVNNDNLKFEEGTDIRDIFLDNNKSVSVTKNNGEAPSKESPLVIDMDLSKASEGNKAVNMERILLKSADVSSSEDSSLPSSGSITYEDENGNIETINFSTEASTFKSDESGNLIIELGKQIAVKKISINVTGNRGNKRISEIAKIEFLNNVYKEIPKPDMNIPQIKTVETSTNLHDERITLTWDAQPNVTAYEVMYQKLDENGNITKTKKLQTNKPNINILDKDIKPYDVYRVSIQSLNGEWSSGYEDATKNPSAFDGKPDNVDSNYNIIQSYYDGYKGTVSEIQVIPITSPEPPRNLTTVQGYKSFTVSWENHIQAREFDIYYRKVGDTDKSWIKANDDNKKVTEDSIEVTNPDKSKLVRSHSYTINDLEDNASYEVRATATNHLGTSKMSSTYIGSTTSVNPPVMSEYKLINRPTDENEIGTTHIIDVRNKLDADGWSTGDAALSYDSEYALVDGDFTTSWKVKDWDTGASYGSNRGSEITFDDNYTIGTIAFAETLEQGYNMSLYKVKVTYWDEEGNQKVVYPTSLQSKVSNDHRYYIVKLSEPITANKIKVDTSGYGGSVQTMSEIRFYEYDSLADDIKALYTDDLRVVLKDSVTQEILDELFNRLNTPDPISNEYHPDKSVLQLELEVAQKLFNDKQVSEKITTLDASIRSGGGGPSLGMQNDWQSLGSVARPGVDENDTSKQIVVYMGSSDPNTKVQITFLQNYGLPGQYQGGTVTIRPGRTEITIPSIISADVEKGGQVMARVTSGSTSANIQIRLSGVTDIPHLDVNNLINDESKENESKEKIRAYISELRNYMANIKNIYPTNISDTDKINNIYPYDEKTSPLNSTDIEGDRFTLTLPASEILKGIENGLVGNEDAQVERVYNALLAWEQEVKVGFAKKGVFESVQDFNNNGEIDAEDNEYFNKHKAPLTRLNIKYQRMMMGAAAYASGHHIGVGFGSAGYMQGVPFKFDSEGNVTNPNEAHLYGALIGHEMGHVMDIGSRIYPETSNNLMVAITSSMLDQDTPYASAMNALYEKVTSNTLGLSTNRGVVLNMLWQPYLAYENNSTYKMLINGFDDNLNNDSYFAKLNRAYREMTEEEKLNADRDQLLIRMTSKVAGKDLTDFYQSHGIVANDTTLEYVSQFPKETKKIQYINDEARRRRMAGTADMEQGTTLSAEFGTDSKGNKITAGSYVNDKNVSINLSVDKSDDNILGYEVYRNGKPCGFIVRNKNEKETIYTDVADNINNRVVEYSAIAYDYNLNPTNEVKIGTVKIRHEGGLAKSSTLLTTNTVSINDDKNDIHSFEGNEDLKLALDDDNKTAYEGRMLNKSEYNSSVHGVEMNPNNDPYLILDTTEMKTLVGIKYTAPLQTTGFIFKKESILNSALNKYKIEVSKDGVNWTTAKEGALNLTTENPTSTIYFDKEGVTGGNQLNAYSARYVKITALGTKNISAAEIELITPPGDNIEIGVADDNINYKNGIGILKESYVYQVDNPETEENEQKSIPAGSIIITGEYRGNPAFNVPLVLNQKEEHIADKYDGILLAEVPDNGNLEEIAEGNWIYWVEPENSASFMENNTEIFAELYRTDSADALEGGQRLVSDTFKIAVPDILPEISLTSGKTRNITSNNIKAIEIKESIINNITENR